MKHAGQVSHDSSPVSDHRTSTPSPQLCLPFTGFRPLRPASHAQSIHIRKWVPRTILPPGVLHPHTDIIRYLLSPHMTHPRKGHINSRAHAAAAPPFPIHHPPCARHPLHLRPLPDHPLPRALVRRRPPSVHQACPRNERSAGAHADQVLQRRVHRRDEVDGRLHVRGASAGAAGHEEDVQRRSRGEGVSREDTLGERAGRGAHGVEGAGDDGEREWMVFRKDVEGVERAEDVQGLEMRVEKDADRERRRSMSCEGLVWSWGVVSIRARPARLRAEIDESGGGGSSAEFFSGHRAQRSKEKPNSKALLHTHKHRANSNLGWRKRIHLPSPVRRVPSVIFLRNR